MGATSASFADGSFEGRVLERAAPLVDFRLPLDALVSAGFEESLLFVAPSLGEPVEYDVDVESDEPVLSPIAWEKPDARASRASIPGAHWLSAPLTLPQEPAVADDLPTLVLPALALRRRRTRIGTVARAFGSRIFGETTAARASRLGLAMALLFAALAVTSLHGAVLSRARLAAPVQISPAADDTPLEASVPHVHLPRPAPAEATASTWGASIVGEEPIWVRVPRPAAPPVVESAPAPRPSDHPLGLPTPSPLPRGEVALK